VVSTRDPIGGSQARELPVNVMTPTSIVRAQTLMKQLSPTPEPSPDLEGLSEKQRLDMVAVKRLQRPLIAGLQSTSTYSGLPPLQLSVQEGVVGLLDGPQGHSTPDGTLASLVYAAYALSDGDGVDSPVLDLLA